jgi:hypothetical protein
MSVCSQGLASPVHLSHEAYLGFVNAKRWRHDGGLMC